jgi:hypothetical protein
MKIFYAVCPGHILIYKKQSLHKRQGVNYQ